MHLLSGAGDAVVSGQAGFALETLIADMGACCLDRLLFKISIHALSLRTVQPSGHWSGVREVGECGGRVPRMTNLSL
jgi:hypothetical protein